MLTVSERAFTVESSPRLGRVRAFYFPLRLIALYRADGMQGTSSRHAQVILCWKVAIQQIRCQAEAGRLADEICMHPSVGNLRWRRISGAIPTSGGRLARKGQLSILVKYIPPLFNLPCFMWILPFSFLPF